MPQWLVKGCFIGVYLDHMLDRSGGESGVESHRFNYCPWLLMFSVGRRHVALAFH